MASGPSSLTKNLPLSVLEGTLSLAQHQMRYGEFLAKARKLTHEDAPGVVVGRFLLEKEGVIIRDHFLSIVESEGTGSARVRKIMYGLWTLRDPRVRDFILKRIVDATGRWQPAEVVRKSNMDHFPDESRQKIRSNIERFLTDTGIFDPRSGVVHLERDDGWLEDAVLSAAQHETQPASRHEMTTDPVGFIIRNSLNGLANTTVAELQSLPAVVVDATEPVFEIETTPTIQAAAPKAWNRPPPTPADRRAEAIKANPVAMERANQAHYVIEKALKHLIEVANAEATCTPHIDMLLVRKEGTAIFEIKSCHAGTFHPQLRRGVSQLLEYRYRYRSTLGHPILLVLLVETPPPSPKYNWIPEYLRSLGIIIAWRSNDGSRFITSEEIPPLLTGILNSV